MRNAVNEKSRQQKDETGRGELPPGKANVGNPFSWREHENALMQLHGLCSGGSIAPTLRCGSSSEAATSHCLASRTLDEFYCSGLLHG